MWRKLCTTSLLFISRFAVSTLKISINLVYTAFIQNSVPMMTGYSHTVYPKKYAHGFCFAVLCCGYTLTDFPISIRLTSLALWQSNDCPSASKATLMSMDKYFMWIHYERLHNHNKARHNKIVCIFLGIHCNSECFWPCWFDDLPPKLYRKVYNIRRTKFRNWNDSHLVLKSSLPNLLKPGVKSSMKL